MTEQAIVDDRSDDFRQIPVCDAFVWCTDATDTTRRSIDSLLQQQHATVIVHLVVGDVRAEALAADYSGVWNVQCHEPSARGGLFRTIHELAPSACTEFLAFQHSKSISLPNRIAGAIGEMQRTGSSLCGSPLLTGGTEIAARIVADEYSRSIPWPTIVCRRDMFIDVGGFAERDGDADVEFVFRCHQSGAKVVVMPLASVELQQPWRPPPVGPRPNYSSRLGSLRHHAIGYPMSNICCDVVLPVHGQLQFVDEAIESILEQEGAESIVHMVDDASPENTAELFQRWSSHPRVRLYRNSQNLGQYASFNNLSEYFENELVAVQDSDDVSHPHRLVTSGNLLKLCEADYFGGKMEQFGDEEVMKTIHASRRYRKSFHPYGNDVLYFAMNPTACFRVDMFRRLGGYTDFGGRERGRSGLDSEFMIRAQYAGARFAFSCSEVARHRIHSGAVTRRKETGPRSAIREFALGECRRRLKLFRSGQCDPRAFGALGRYRNATQRLG